MKRCFKCQAQKPLADFYRHKRMADGHLNKCKDCTISDVKSRRAAASAHYREYDRSRDRLSDRVAARKRLAEQRRSDPDATARRDATHAAWRAQNREKRKCHSVVQAAIKSGRLTAMPCARCSDAGGTQAHHEDYSRPLDVTWLCAPCHGERHREINHNRRTARAAA